MKWKIFIALFTLSLTSNLDSLAQISEKVFAPDAFSPNGDNLNDRYEVFFDPAEVQIEEAAIFNRWGERVFHFPSSGVNDWDGYRNGTLQLPGTYILQIVGRVNGGEPESFTKQITLVW